MTIRILRVLEYEYDDHDHMIRDMGRWGLAANGMKHFGPNTLRSAALPPSGYSDNIENWPEIISQVTGTDWGTNPKLSEVVDAARDLVSSIDGGYGKEADEWAEDIRRRDIIPTEVGSKAAARLILAVEAIEGMKPEEVN